MRKQQKARENYFGTKGSQRWQKLETRWAGVERWFKDILKRVRKFIIQGARDTPRNVPEELEQAVIFAQLLLELPYRACDMERKTVLFI